MNDRLQQRLADIAEALTAIASQLERGDLSDVLIFESMRIRLPLPAVGKLLGNLASHLAPGEARLSSPDLAP